MKTLQSEQDYTCGAAMLTLRTKIGLTQAKLADLLGITRLAVGKWETGNAYPKPEHLKALIELAVQHQAFSTENTAEEIRALWKVARQKVLLDEHWLSTLIQGQAQELPVEHAQVQDVAPPLVSETTNHTPATIPYSSETKEKSDDTPATPVFYEHKDTKSPQTTRRPKWLLAIVITLVIFSVIGSAGALFFYAREQASKTATDPDYPGYLTGHGTLAFFDPLREASGSKWSSHTNSYGSACQFTGGAYHVSKPQPDSFSWCAAHGIFSNFAFEVQLTIMQGDCGGVTFRDGDNKGYYKFCICENGTYEVIKYLSYSGPDSLILQSNQSSAIHSGLEKPNKIAVVAAGSIMTFYVNEQQIDQEQDSSYTSGQISLIAHPFYPDGHVTDVAYSNARLWTL